IAYSTSNSMNEELDKGTKSDILFFSLTFTFMITFASLVSSGGDCVSSRMLLANAGVLGVVMGILGAIGLVALCGVNFVSIVATMPFLTLGIGVDDMFLLMNSWSETLPVTSLSIPERIGTVFKKAGIGITITSGVGVLMCYICNACMFGSCLTLHARRVYASRHILTCRKVKKSRRQLKEKGASCCTVYLCGGEIPNTSDGDQSVCEQGPRKTLVRFLMWNPVRYLTLLVFAGYLGVAIWGCTKLQQGLDLKNLAPRSSYFHKFQEMKQLLEKAEEDPLIMPDSRICWFLSLAGSKLYYNSSPAAFYSGLEQFLRRNPFFESDVVFGPNKTITASRCHVYSYRLADSTDQANLMTRMRQVADASPAAVFAYHPVFVLFEQFVTILPDTLQTVGVTIAVMFVVTAIFLPHPLMVILVTVQMFMIVLGIFGFMAHWDLTLSSITMIELIMSVGFSVDFCAHVCTAYMISDEHSSMDRAKDAIIHASGPIFNGGLSSFIGVFILIFSESYIFQSFFKIMVLVIGFGVAHAVFLVPVTLSFIGPKAHVHLEPVMV
ncbi:unnamed protein product, partial [Candidula unifasciata]